MLVSLVILNQNQGAVLGGAIDSALAQEDCETEVLVIDAGSTDRSQDVMSHYGDRIVPIHLTDQRQAAAINAGFAASRGEWVCFLSADDLLKCDRISLALKALQAYPTATWIAHQSNPVDLSGRSFKIQQSKPLKTVEVEQAAFHRLPSSGIGGGLYRRSQLQRVLPMPERAYLNHLYVQFSSCAFSSGIVLSAILHESRQYGGRLSRRDKKQLNAKAYLSTAYWLRLRFPERYRETDKLFAIGLGLSYKTGGLDAESLELVKQYWLERPQTKKFHIQAIALYHALLS